MRSRAASALRGNERRTVRAHTKILFETIPVCAVRQTLKTGNKYCLPGITAASPYHRNGWKIAHARRYGLVIAFAGRAAGCGGG
jgi:hypothetical protein